MTHIAKNLGEELFKKIATKAQAAGRHTLYPLKEHDMSEPITNEVSNHLKNLYEKYYAHLAETLKGQHRVLY